MREKMHILVVPTWYPNGEDKLIGLYHRLYCEALCADGRFITNVLYVDRQRISKPVSYLFMKKTYAEDNGGYTVYGRRILDLSKLSFDRQMKNYVNALSGLYAEYEKKHGRPDIIHAQVAVPAGYAAVKLGEKHGIPVVVTEHATYFERFFEGSEKPYTDCVMQNAKITCVGEFMREAYKKKFGIEVEVLPNIVDCAQHAATPKVKGDGTFRLLSVCALRDSKRIDIAIRALKIIAEDGSIPKFKYTVVGDGYFESVYKRTAAELGMETYVNFVGRKNSAEICELMAESDALIVSSEIETFCIPAIEALASGLPVISTRCKGPEDFLDEKSSEMCNVNDPEDMARAVRAMYRRSFDESYLRSIPQKYSMQAVAERAYQIYSKVLEGTGGARQA